jgi:tetraacyldisaccharide-1-P 4'-kinase
VATELHGRVFDIVILDDGFQHWKIFKDCEILAVTSHTEKDIFYRDFSGEAQRADLVVWTKGDAQPQSIDLSRAWTKVRYNLDISPADRNHAYWLISAIGDAESFKKTVELSGLKVMNETRLSDHAAFSRAQIEKWLSEAKAKNWKIGVTGKDWVKWRVAMAGSPQTKELPNLVSVFEPKLIFESGRDAWERVLWS